MKTREYWKVIRRKWPVILVTGLAAALVLWLVTPAVPPPVERVTGYNATATLLVNGDAASLDRIALFITTGEVPQRAAEQLGFTEDPALLANRLTVAVNPSSQSLTLSSSGSDGADAAAVANAFAEQAVDFFSVRQDGVGVARLTVLQEATPIPVIATGGFTIPPSRTVRTVLGGFLGLLIGFGLALVLHQFDSRLRTRDEVYEALGMPVIAEVPKFSRGQRDSRRILVADEPHGVYADGYRAARAAITHTVLRSSVEPDLTRPALGPAGSHTPSAKVVLLTSALASEGKTTSIANLAATYAETGRSVLVLDADLRSPDLHLRFDVPQGAGISDFLYDPAATRLASLARPTSVPGVRIITAGTQLAHPASLAARMGTLVDEARLVADVVLIDTAPLLAASDVFDLLPLVDTVLFVVRSGRLTENAARRVSELLGRFHVPVTGAILIGVSRRRSGGYGYGYGYGYGNRGGKGDSASERPSRRERRQSESLS